MSRCSQCWNYGHNKRTCPQITKTWQARYDEAKDAKDQRLIDHWGELLGKRTGIDPRTGAKVNRRAGIVRRCSYCKYVYGAHGDEGIGHTRRTCPQLKKDRVAENEKNGALRKKVVEAMKREGIGVGTIIGFNTYDYYSNGNGDKVYESRPYPYMVVAINWDCITDQQGVPRALSVRRLDQVCKAGAEKRGAFPLPVLYESDDETLIKNTQGSKPGNWNLSTDPEGYDARFLMERAPDNGWDTIPAAYYQGSSKHTDSWFNDRKR